MNSRTGRQREASEIVRYKKAAAVGRLLLGELDGPMEPISAEQYVNKPRKNLISERDASRATLRGEIAKFCRNNFEDIEPEDLTKLYDVLLEHRSEWYLPLTDFVRDFGRFKPGVLKGAPLHSTIHISPWGLQTEYAEQDLLKDLAVSLNEAIEIAEHRLTPYRTKSWRERKEQRTRFEIAEWEAPPGKSVVAEVYPALWSHTFSRDGRNSDQHDAYSAAEWLRRSGLDGSLDRFFNPHLDDHERKVAEVEGWILGIA